MDAEKTIKEYIDQLSSDRFISIRELSVITDIDKSVIETVLDKLVSNNILIKSTHAICCPKCSKYLTSIGIYSDDYDIYCDNCNMNLIVSLDDCEIAYKKI